MALDIELFDKYKITSDEYGITLLRKIIVDPTKAHDWEKRKADGASPDKRINWSKPTYHSTVEQTLQRIMDFEIRDSEAKSITELLEEIKRIRRDIGSVMDERL